MNKMENVAGDQTGFRAGGLSGARDSLLSVFLLFALAFCVPEAVLAQGSSFDVGIMGGYAMGQRLHASAPSNVHGGGVGLHLTYNFDETWGIYLEGQLDWYRDFVISEPRPVSSVEVPGTGGAPSPETESYVLTSVQRANALTACLGVLYQIDVLTITPYLSVGLLGIRAAQFFNGSPNAGYAWGARLALGADYSVLSYLNVGLALHNDIIVGGVSEYSNRLSVVARLTYMFHFGKSSTADVPR